MRKQLIWGLKFLVTVVLFFAIASRIPLSEISASFASLDWTGVSWAVVLLIPNLGIQFLRWRYLVRIVEPSTPRSEIAVSLFSGFSVGLVTPGRIGELGRGLFIRDGSRAKLTGFVIIEKMISLWSLSLLGVCGFLLLRARERIFSIVLNNVFIGLGLFLLTGLIILILDPNFLRRWVRRSSVLVNRLPFTEKLMALLEASEEFKKAHLPLTFFFSLVFQFVILIQIHLLLNAFGPAGVVESLAAGSAAMLVKSVLPFTVMDLGIREGALIFFMGNIGVPAAAALNASLLLFVINVLLPSFIGYGFILRRSLRKS